MQATTENEVWRQIPPEEKLRLIAKSQGNGVMAASGLLVTFVTVGVGLKMNWIIWLGLLASPLVFQLNAGRSWRRLRPKLMLEYLAARSASRRYAFSCHAQDLGVTFVFRGTLARKYHEDQVQDIIEDTINNLREVEVWVTLFRDAIVMISEGPGGAKLEFGQAINEKLIIGTDSGREPKQGTAREVVIGSRDREKGETMYSLKSSCPAALTVFERKLLIQREDIRRMNERIAAAQVAALSE